MNKYQMVTLHCLAFAVGSRESPKDKRTGGVANWRSSFVIDHRQASIKQPSRPWWRCNSEISFLLKVPVDPFCLWRPCGIVQDDRRAFYMGLVWNLSWLQRGSLLCILLMLHCTLLCYCIYEFLPKDVAELMLFALDEQENWGCGDQCSLHCHGSIGCCTWRLVG